MTVFFYLFFFFSSRRRHTILVSDWSSDVCSSDLERAVTTPGYFRAFEEEATLGPTYRRLGELYEQRGDTAREIGRASCRERGENWGGGRKLTKKEERKGRREREMIAGRVDIREQH